jgi:tRNA A58 N-methylase Trm61
MHVRRGVVSSLLTAVLISLVLPAAQARQQADEWGLDIEQAMDYAGIFPGMIVGEAGAGRGYFTLPMARRVGATGAAYANDIDRRSLETLAERASAAGLVNVHTVEGAVDDPRFPRHDLQRIVIVHAFHDFSQPVTWLVKAKPYLAPGGQVAIIDLDPNQGASSHFWPMSKILGYADAAGFEVVKSSDTISKHLVVLLRPKAPAGEPGSAAG